jgi:hypothetical protein
MNALMYMFCLQDLDAWELERLLSGKFDNAGCQVATIHYI